jgi:hypothetical protein
MALNINARDLRRDVLEQLQPFRAGTVVPRGEPGGVAARPRQACDETEGEGRFLTPPPRHRLFLWMKFDETKAMSLSGSMNIAYAD